MKEWNAPSIEELNVTETANGIVNSEVEFWWISNDNKSSTSSTPSTPSTPDKKDPVEQLS